MNWQSNPYAMPLLIAACIAASLALFAWRQRRAQAPASVSFSLLMLALAPWIGNVLYLAQVSPFDVLDPTPFAFTLTGLLLAWRAMR